MRFAQRLECLLVPLQRIKVLGQAEQLKMTERQFLHLEERPFPTIAGYLRLGFPLRQLGLRAQQVTAQGLRARIGDQSVQPESRVGQTIDALQGIDDDQRDVRGRE